MSDNKSTIEDFQALMDVLPDFVARYDADGRILYISSKIRDKMGLKLEDFLGKTTGEIFPDGSFKEYSDKVFYCVTTGKSCSYEMKFLDPFTGKTEFYHINFAPEFNKEGKLVGCFGVGRDLTDKVNLEQQMIAMSRLTSLGEMASGVAHEINNPLSIVLGKCNLMKEMVANNMLSPEQVIKSVESIEKAAQRINKIVKGLRHLTGTIHNDHLEVVSAKELLKETLAVFEPLLDGHEIEVQKIYLDREDHNFECEPSDFAQILSQLVTNARDAALSQESKWVRIDIVTDEDNFDIVVTDSGKGIPLDVQSRMMDPFYTTKEVGKGTGLGLSLAQSIAKKYSWNLSYSSKDGHTSFILRIPKHN